jgi:hypothetical protein
MTVQELIAELIKLPRDAEVKGMYVADYNYEFEILSVEVEDKEWSLREGKYLDIRPKVVLS